MSIQSSFRGPGKCVVWPMVHSDENRALISKAMLRGSPIPTELLVQASSISAGAVAHGQVEALLLHGFTVDAEGNWRR